MEGKASYHDWCQFLPRLTEAGRSPQMKESIWGLSCSVNPCVRVPNIWVLPLITGWKTHVWNTLFCLDAPPVGGRWCCSCDEYSQDFPLALFLHTASDQKLGRGRGLGMRLHKMVYIRSYHIRIVTKVWHLLMYHTLTLYPCRLLVGCAGCHRCGGSFRVYCDNASACNSIPQQKTNS